MADEYDGIVLGTGNNALVLQAYSRQRAQKLCPLDRAAMPGGGLQLKRIRVSPASCTIPIPFFIAPSLRCRGSATWSSRLVARIIFEPELNVAMILPDGRSLEWWTDSGKTVDSFAEFSSKDASNLRRWIDEFRPIVESVLIPEARSAPLAPDRRRALLERSRLGRRLLELARAIALGIR